MDGNVLLHQVATVFAICFDYLHVPLFYLGGRAVNLWNICLSCLWLTIFRDFLDIVGIWGYSEDDIDDDAA